MRTHPHTGQRRRWAVVAALLAVAALLPAATPAGAEPAEAPDITAACANAESAGFTDTAGTGFADVIDCLAAFGVTTGTTATTYSPAVQVRRSQMALFYYRIGELAGVDWDTSSAGFTDLGGLQTQFVTAINALANAGIVNGTTPTTFDPQGRIRRSQMALFIDRFQDLDEVGGARYSDGFSGSDLFPDISTLPTETRAAINGIGSVGITQGDAAGNYVPNGFVSRQQMAAFVVRHLAENGFTVPADGIAGMLVEFNAGSDYTISTGSALVEVTIGDDDTFSINGASATEASFEGALGSSTSGLGHLVTWNEAEGHHDVVARDDATLLTLGLTVGPNLDLLDGADLITSVDDVSGDLVEPVSGVTIVADAQVGWGDNDQLRVGNTTVTSSEMIEILNWGDTLTITTSGGVRRFTLANRTMTGDIGDLADIGGGGGSTNVQIEVYDYTTGNDLNGADNFHFNEGRYDAGLQAYTLNGSVATYGDVESFLTGLDASDIDDGVTISYQRTDNVERFTITG